MILAHLKDQNAENALVLVANVLIDALEDVQVIDLDLDQVVVLETDHVQANVLKIVLAQVSAQVIALAQQANDQANALAMMNVQETVDVLLVEIVVDAFQTMQEKNVQVDFKVRKKDAPVVKN